MENILKSINAVSGVTGCFVSDDEGHVLASALPDIFDESILSTVGYTVFQTMAGLANARKRKVGEIDLLYDQGRFLAIDLGGSCLCILCVSNINLPLLNLTANMAARKLAPLVKERKEKRTQQTTTQEAFVSRSQLLINEVQTILSTAWEQAVLLQATGDIAIRLHCPSAGRIAPHLDDKILDLVGRDKQAKQLTNLLKNIGFLPEQRFNFLQGDQRLRFVHPEKKLGVEVFLNVLNMYHQLHFAERITPNEYTLPLSDLLLWKLQYVEPDEDTLRCIYAIVHDHELDGDGDVEKIDTARILDMCANDWGWYKTVTINLETSINQADNYLGDESAVFIERAQRLQQLIEEVPKSGGWQLRARIGESRRWYVTPD